jgi:kinesin family protein C1
VKEELRKEVECLRTDLQQVRDDRDQSVAQVNTLTTELATYSEEAKKSSKDCAILSSKVSAFEVCAINSFGKFACGHLAYHYA